MLLKFALDLCLNPIRDIGMPQNKFSDIWTVHCNMIYITLITKTSYLRGSQILIRQVVKIAEDQPQIIALILGQVLSYGVARSNQISLFPSQKQNTKLLSV